VFAGGWLVKVFVYALAISMLLHVFVLSSVPSHEQKLGEDHTKPLELPIHLKEAAPKALVPKAKIDISKSPSKGHSRVPQYSDFLLKDNGTFIEDGAREEFNGYHGQIYQHIIAASTDLEARLKIPFILRSELDEGEGRVELERMGPGAFRIVELTGNPFLRAALYEAVLDRKNRQLFMEIFDNMHTISFEIHVRFDTKSYLWADPDVFDEKVSLKRREVDLVYLHKKFLTPIHPAPGINFLNFEISDEGIERSRRLDEAERDELKTCPAFSHDIHDLAVD